MKKKSTTYSTLLLIIMCVCIATTTAYAAGTYTSTYDMKGGVFSDNITASEYIITSIVPRDGMLGGSIGVILATKHLYGWDGPVREVDSAKGGTVTYSCNGTYKIWLRNFTTMRVTGKVTFSWR